MAVYKVKYELNNLLYLLRIRPFRLFQFRITSGILNSCRNFVGLFRWEISRSRGLCLYKIAQ